MATIVDLITEARRGWDDAKTLARIGKELQDRNRQPQAREVLARALALDPKSDPEAWESYAFAHFRDHDEKGGYDALRRGVEETDADSVRSTLMNFSEDEAETARLRAQVEKSADPVVQASLQWRNLNEGKVEEALTAIRAIFRANPGNSQLRDLVLWALISAKRSGKLASLREEGLPIVERKLREEPDRCAGHTMRLSMLAAEKDWDASIAAAKESLARFPDEESIMQLLGRAYREKGDLDRAALWFSRAIGAKPSFAGARIDLGKLLEQQGKLELAEELFREIAVANPTYAMGGVSLALFLARRGRWEEAEDAFLAAWPKLRDWQQSGLKQNADAAPLLAREKVKKAL